MRCHSLVLTALLALSSPVAIARVGAQRAPSPGTATAADPRQQERSSLMRYCNHVDSASASTLEGVRERTDCWKRIQLEGMGDALVEERYRAAVRDYDTLVAADSARRATAAREAQVDQQLTTVQRALVARDLARADSTVMAVLAFQPQNQRALAFKERVVSLRRADQLRRAVYVVAGLVLVAALVLLLSARIMAVRQTRAVEAERQQAAMRTPMLRIIDGVGRGKTYTISGPIFRIGSAQSDRPEEQNELVLSDESAFVSRYHCAILRRDGRYYLIDTSLNGTYVDDELVERGEPTLLEDGSEFTLSGVTRLKFLLV
jgi:hypothetical protein